MRTSSPILERPRAKGVADRPLMTGRSRQLALACTLLGAESASLVAMPGPDGLLGTFLAALMLAIAIIDAERYIIPDDAVALALLRAGLVGPEADGWTVLWAASRVAAIALPLLALMAGYRR
jgi:leader peptidase (prepilin peptidase)/N-methyltransferase